MHSVMEGGGDTLSSVAASLRRAADGRERDEEEATNRFRKLGEDLGVGTGGSSSVEVPVSKEAEVAAVLKDGIAGSGEGITDLGDGVAGSVGYLSALVSGQVEGADPVPDPEAGRQTYYEAMEWAKPIVDLGESVWSHLDAISQDFLRRVGQMLEWGDRYVEIGPAVNAWARSAERVTNFVAAAAFRPGGGQGGWKRTPGLGRPRPPTSSTPT